MKKRQFYILNIFILGYLFVVTLLFVTFTVLSNLPDKRPPIITATPTDAVKQNDATRMPLGVQIHTSIPYWDQESAFATVKQHPDKFQTISMFWYYINSDLDIASYEYANVDDSLISFAHEHNIKVLALVTNLPDSEGSDWSSDRVRTLIEDDDKRADHIKDLIDLIESKNFDGINVDYEELDDDLKNEYSQFIKELSAEMHERGKIVGVAIHPKSGENIPSEDNGSRAQDWTALGQYADQLYFMTHGEHWNTSEAGPIASLKGNTKVINYAKKLNVPMQKIYLGVPLFGIRWEAGTKNGEGVLYTDVEELIRKYSIKPQWDNTAEVPYIKFSEDGKNYELWYENAQSVKEKMAFAEKNGLGGLTYWRLGGEDAGVWNNL